MASKLQVVDGDGHLVTDIAAVASRMPQEYLNRATGSSLGNIFPPIDHLHARPSRSRRRPGRSRRSASRSG